MSRSIRTDLASEIREYHAAHGVSDGLTEQHATLAGFPLTHITILPEGETATGRPAGEYYTLDTGKLWLESVARAEAAADALASLLIPMLGDPDGTVLVACLGNRAITADAIGPQVMRRLLITRHVARTEFRNAAGLGSLAAVAPGVLGETGIESAEIVRAAALSCNASAVIAIDALASRRLSRLATTVQLSDTGIRPGSGVSNARSEISVHTLGVPVLALGIPTVVEASTLALDLLEELTGNEDPALLEAIGEKLLAGSGRESFISPRDIDIVVSAGARLLADAVNRAVHRRVPKDEIEDYLRA